MGNDQDFNYFDNHHLSMEPNRITGKTDYKSRLKPFSKYRKAPEKTSLFHKINDNNGEPLKKAETQYSKFSVNNKMDED